MISIWEGLAWAVIGLLVGIVLGDPDKKKYFEQKGGDGVKKQTIKKLIKASSAFLGSKKATPAKRKQPAKMFGDLAHRLERSIS